MPFDEQLRRVFDAAFAELAEGARVEAEHAREDGRATGLEEGHTKGLEEGHTKGLEEGHAKGLEEGRVQGWEDGREQGRFEGRQEAEETLQAEHAIQLAAAAATAAPAADGSGNLDRLLDAIRAIDRARSLGEVLDTVAACAGREASRAAVFLVRPSGVRGWRFIGFDASFADASAIEAASADAAAIAVALAARGAAADGDGSTALPLLVGGETVALLYADGLPNGSAAPADARLEILARHAGASLESLTALKAARALLQSPDGAAGAGSADGPDGNNDNAADAAARRYAKLLVSEIKLYHEPAVVAGRRDRDLAERLGGEIARARALYEQRVPAAVRQRSDYFRDELVRTLANGDPSLLQLT